MTVKEVTLLKVHEPCPVVDGAPWRVLMVLPIAVGDRIAEYTIAATHPDYGSYVFRGVELAEASWRVVSKPHSTSDDGKQAAMVQALAFTGWGEWSNDWSE